MAPLTGKKLCYSMYWLLLALMIECELCGWLARLHVREREREDLMCSCSHLYHEIIIYLFCPTLYISSHLIFCLCNCQRELLYTCLFAPFDLMGNKTNKIKERWFSKH